MWLLCFLSPILIFAHCGLAHAEDAAPSSGPTFSTVQIVIAGIVIVVCSAFGAAIRNYIWPPAEGEEANPGFWRKFLSDHPFVVILLGGFLLAVGISFTEHGWSIFRVDINFLGHLIAEFGIALIIAYFISVSIEEYSRRRHNTHVAKQLEMIERSVFEAIYKVRLDPKFFNFIEEALFKHPFFRKGYRIGMRIEPHESVRHKEVLSPEDPVVVSITVRSAIHNISTTKLRKRLSTMIEKSSHSVFADESRLCSMTIGQAKRVFKDDREFVEIGDLVVTEGYKRYTLFTDIDAGGAVKVEYEYRVVKFARDEMSWRVADPCEDFLLTLNHGGALMSFGAPMHWRRDVEPRKDVGGVNLELEIADPLFPFNGAVVWWRPAVPVAYLPPPTQKAAAVRENAEVDARAAE